MDDKKIPSQLQSIAGVRRALKMIERGFPTLLTLCNSLEGERKCVGLVCTECILWYGSDYELRHLQTKPNAVQFLLEHGLITKGVALELTLDSM